MRNRTRMKQASAKESEPGRSAAQDFVGTKRSVDAALIDVSLEGPATHAAAPGDEREKGAAAARESDRPPRAPFDDVNIAAAAANLLAWHATDLGYKVRVTVHKGWVTLSGHVDWTFQKDAVEQDVRRLPGVTGVTNTIEGQVVAGSGRSDAAHDGCSDADHVPGRAVR